MPATSAAAAAAREALLKDLARGRPRLSTPRIKRLPAQPYTYNGASDGPGLELQPLIFQSDDSPQGQVPCLILRPTGPAAVPPPPLPPTRRPRTQQQQQQQQQVSGLQHRRPAVVLLHASYSQKESMLPEMAAYARRGYVAATIDNRYHGGRAQPHAVTEAAGPAAAAAAAAVAAAVAAGKADGGPNRGAVYQEAVVAAWRGSGERPFLLDTAWDIIHLLDVVETLPDVDPHRIGMGGISLGGMLTWLVAAADDRVAVAAPSIGIQNWGWALKHDAWQARLESVPMLAAAAAADCGKGAVPDAAVAEAVLRQLLPGLLDWYDTPSSLQAIAPRPLLALNGEFDPRCPIKGVREAFAAAAPAYRAAGAPEGALALRVFEGVGHEYVPAMSEAAAAFFKQWL